MNSSVARQAAAVARERRLQQVRPGWWVFSLGPRDLGSWGRVTANVQFLDPATRRMRNRLTVTDPASGQRHEIEHASGYPAWCCTPAEARRAGLT